MAVTFTSIETSYTDPASGATVTNPTISVTDLWPERSDYGQGILNDPTVRANIHDGKPLYRSGDEPMYRTWSFVLRHLSAEKKEELEAFQEAIGVGTEPFYYTDIRPTAASGGGAGDTYVVTLAQPIVFDLDDAGTAYRCEVFLDEFSGYIVMSNNFSRDPFTAALYRFENGALTVDSIGGNTLTATGTPTADTINYKEGAAACDFGGGTAPNNDWFYRVDGGLDAGFPFKSGDTVKKGSVCFWVKFDVTNKTQGLVSKGGNSAQFSFEIRANYTAPNLRFQFGVGYNTGLLVEWNTLTTLNIAADVWYHVGVTYDDSDKSYRLRVYDATADTVYELTGNTTNNINVENGMLMIGSWFNYLLDGLLDEVVILKDVLTADEIDQIRAGTYGALTAAQAGMMLGFHF